MVLILMLKFMVMISDDGQSSISFSESVISLLTRSMSKCPLSHASAVNWQENTMEKKALASDYQYQNQYIIYIYVSLIIIVIKCVVIMMCCEGKLHLESSGSCPPTARSSKYFNKGSSHFWWSQPQEKVIKSNILPE